MLNRLVAPVESKRVVTTRMVVGAASLLRSLIALPTLLKLADPDFLTTPVFDWMPEPSVTLAYGLTFVWAALSVLFILGWRLPWTGSALIFCIGFVLCLDYQNYGNHLYLMCWLILLLTIAGPARDMAGGSPTPVARWTVLLIMLQVSAVYLFAGLTKLNDGFLSGEVLAGVLGGGLLPFPESLRTPAFLGLIAGLAVLSEVFVAFGLWLPRTRKVAYVVGVGLHGSIALFMSPASELVVFGMLMASTYPLFSVGAPGRPGRAGQPLGAV